jgi:hypothetical protein
MRSCVALEERNLFSLGGGNKGKLKIITKVKGTNCLTRWTEILLTCKVISKPK